MARWAGVAGALVVAGVLVVAAVPAVAGGAACASPGLARGASAKREATATAASVVGKACKRVCGLVCSAAATHSTSSGCGHRAGAGVALRRLPPAMDSSCGARDAGLGLKPARGESASAAARKSCQPWVVRMALSCHTAPGVASLLAGSLRIWPAAPSNKSRMSPSRITTRPLINSPGCSSSSAASALGRAIAAPALARAVTGNGAMGTARAPPALVTESAPSPFSDPARPRADCCRSR